MKPRATATRGIGLVVVSLALAVLSGCSSSPAAKPVPPTRAQAQRLLDGLARDVLGHRSSAFAAALDQSSASAAFRAEQAGDLANLAAIPFTSWSYDVDSVSTNHATVAAAAKKYGAPALIAGVTIKYALAGVDGVPDSHSLWLTFVQRGKTTLLASDSDLASAGFPSWAGPWRYGPIAVQHGKASLLLGPTGDPALLKSLSDEVDAAVPAVSAVWGTGWSQRVAVIVPESTAEFAALVGSGTAVSDISASAVTGGIDPLSGKPFGQRLVLNPSNLAHLTTLGRRIVLRHEITHLATATDTADTTPRWLVEGFAEYVGNLGSGQSTTTTAQELTALVRHGSVPKALPAEAAWGATGAALARLYEESWLACKLLVAKVGQAGLVRFYWAVGTALSPAAEAVAGALQSVLHESLATFTAQWRAYVHTQLS